MKLPSVAEPRRYQGLYVYDFGAWSAVGYTAAEIAILLEDPNYRGGTVYRIHRAAPDGTFELRGVSPDRWQLESGVFFYRSDAADARRDFNQLAALGEQTRPPCRAFVQLVDRMPQFAGGPRLVGARAESSAGRGSGTEQASSDGRAIAPTPMSESELANRFATVMVFPAEYEDDVGRWLLAIGYQGGEIVEGGISLATRFYEEQKAILDRHQLWSDASGSRSAEQVLGSVRQAVQR